MERPRSPAESSPDKGNLKLERVEDDIDEGFFCTNAVATAPWPFSSGWDLRAGWVQTVEVSLPVSFCSLRVLLLLTSLLDRIVAETLLNRHSGGGGTV